MVKLYFYLIQSELLIKDYSTDVQNNNINIICKYL